MTSISYAQNFEDVILARALVDVSEGFYVDVGAQDPVIDSVTRMFYERGWKGINIEPVFHWFERLQADRPRDVNLMCAISTREGSLTLHESTDSGLSTSSAEYARNHAAAGWNMVKRSVPSRRLEGILAQHAPEVVHFLKIDVEGMESEVLASLSLSRFRPWILVIEATQPNTTVDVSQAWEASVLEAGYRLAYRDGLNRFYLAEEQLSRLAAFDVPPNVLDDFIPYREHVGNEYAKSLEQRLELLHGQTEGFRHDLLVVTETAHASQRRMGELEVVLQQRQLLLEETARTAEKYRTDLLVIAEAAENRKQRIEELAQAIALAHQEIQIAHSKNLLAQRELHLVALAAENRRVLIEGLEGRLGQSDDELRQLRQALRVTSTRVYGLQKQLDAVFSSRSWRLTAPMRSLTGSARTMLGRVFRRMATTPILRKIGNRILKGRVRARILSLAGFQMNVDDRASIPLLNDDTAEPSGLPPLTRAAARVYRLLSLANGRDQGRQ